MGSAVSDCLVYIQYWFRPLPDCDVVNFDPSGYSQSCSANSLQVENFLIRRAALLRMRSSVAHAQAAHIPARRTAYGASACVRAFKDWESYRCLFVFCSISCYNL